jgi:hypothetical protein
VKHLPPFPVWVAALLPWAFIWQGVDFTDQGYLLTGYRNFFAHPETTQDSATLWLTNLVGASWDAVFGSLGVVGMRALWALCLSAGMLLAYRFVRDRTDPDAACIAVLVASASLSDRRETWFSYNTLTSLLYLGAALLLTEGIVRRNRARLFAAGVVIGIMPFARFPNVLGVVLLSVLLLAAWLEPERRAGLLRDLASSCAGVAAGFAALWLVVVLRGDAAMVIGSVRDLFAPASTQSGHGTSSLLQAFIREQSEACAWGAGIGALGFGLSHALSRLHRNLAYPLVAITAGLGVFAMIQLKDSWSTILCGLVYAVLVSVVFGLLGRRFELRVAAYLALGVLCLAPLGSNNGIKNALVGLWLAMPLAAAALASLDASQLRGQGPKLASVLLLVLAGEAVFQSATYTYRDRARRHLKTSVGHPQLAAQFTTPARAKSVKQVLTALEQRVAPGDYLLAYEGTPLLQYLTKTRPYLNRPWLSIAESGGVVARLAKEAPGRTGCLPVAVLTTKSTRSSGWPLQSRRLENSGAQRDTRHAINKFLRAYDYKETWSNGFFKILEVPSEVGKHCR